MTSQELKNSILLFAVQGKLVPQNPHDEPASELLKKIKAEKEKLIKEKVIKKEKPSLPIAEEEKPFELPESWEWVRLGDAFNLVMGQSPDGNSVTSSTKGMEFHQGKVFFTDKYINKSNQTTSKPSKIASPNSVLLCVRAPVGIVNITNREICIGRGLCAIRPVAGISVYYIFYMLLTYKHIFVKQATGTTFVAITGEIVKNQVIPLPPLAEQQSIVDKIEELLPYVEQYGTAESELRKLNSKFPEQLKKSVLEYAVQGKLVPQNPHDEPTSLLLERIKAEKKQLIKEKKIKQDKPLPTIKEDEIPFEIPNSWEWVRLGEIVTIKGGKRVSNGYQLLTIPTLHIYIRVSDMKNGTISDSNLHYLDENMYQLIKQYIISKDDLYMTIVGATIGKCGVVPEKFHNMNLTENAAKITPILVDKMFLLMCLNSAFCQNQFIDKTNQVGVQKMALNRFTTSLIPLPPLSEQKLIVEKVEEVLGYCDKLR